MKNKKMKPSALSYAVLLLVTLPALSTVYDSTCYTDIDVVNGGQGFFFCDPVNFDLLHTGQPAVGAKYANINECWFNLYGSNGDGTFSILEQGIEMPGRQFYDIFNLTGDLNGDGYSDLFTSTNGSYSKYMLFSIPGGGMSASSSFTPSSWTQICGVCDMDGDSPPDMYGTSAGSVIVWYGEGSENFDVVEVSTGLSAYHASAGDLDLDGDIDIIFISESEDIYILENEGNRVFTNIGTCGPLSWTGDGVLLGDLNGDGYLDITAICSPDQQEAVFQTFLNDGSANFSYSGEFLTSKYLSFCATLDIDMDDCADLAVFCGGFIDIYKGDGFGSFQNEPTLFSVSNAAERLMTFNDYDCDGDPDMVCALFEGNDCYLRSYWNTTVTQGCEGEPEPSNDFHLFTSSNPFRNGVTITSSDCSHPVELIILDLSGRIVTHLSPETNGIYSWDGTNLSGEQAPAGVYTVSAQFAGSAATVRLLKLD